VGEHPIDPAWRIKRSELYLAYSEAVGALLAHIEDNIDIATDTGDEEVVNALRGVRGLMRSRFTDITREGEKDAASTNTD
jgi:hypothetical protein